MHVWGDDYHETHDPTEPRNIGFSTGVVYCRACGTLLRSDTGMSVNARVRQPCEPVAVGFRDATAHLTETPTGFRPLVRNPNDD